MDTMYETRYKTIPHYLDRQDISNMVTDLIVNGYEVLRVTRKDCGCSELMLRRVVEDVALHSV